MTLYNEPTVIYDEPSITYDGLTIADYPLTAVVLSASISIGGSEVANPNFSMQDAGSSPFADSMENVWTMSGNAHIFCTETVKESCAPWYDPTIPASGEFLGFFPHDITLNPVTSREVVPRAQVGASIGSARLNPRTINVSGTMFASTPRGMAYGERWLAEVLRGKLCQHGCPDDEVVVLTSCGEEATDAEFRKLVNAGLVDGPIFSEMASGVPECVLQRVSFIITSTMPWVYGNGVRHLNSALVSGGAHSSLTTPDWHEGSFVIEVDNVGSGNATVTIVGRHSLDGSCPVDPPGTSVPPLFSYIIPSLPAGDKVIIDGTRRQAMHFSSNFKLATSALPVLNFPGPFRWPDAAACQTTCLSITGSSSVRATVESYIREL